jgi:hypothetical protein
MVSYRCPRSSCTTSLRKCRSWLMTTRVRVLEQEPRASGARDVEGWSAVEDSASGWRTGLRQQDPDLVDADQRRRVSVCAPRGCRAPSSAAPPRTPRRSVLLREIPSQLAEAHASCRSGRPRARSSPSPPSPAERLVPHHHDVDERTSRSGNGLGRFRGDWDGHEPRGRSIPRATMRMNVDFPHRWGRSARTLAAVKTTLTFWKNSRSPNPMESRDVSMPGSSLWGAAAAAARAGSRAPQPRQDRPLHAPASCAPLRASPSR